MRAVKFLAGLVAQFAMWFTLFVFGSIVAGCSLAAAVLFVVAING